MSRDGELALVLHTHMPYVEGFGTWPFGEEWLWEAIATLLPAAARRARRDAPITLSLTPVLCDQLEAPGATERCLAFLREIRPESHRRDVAAFRAVGAASELAAELERSAAEYAAAADRLEALPAGSRGRARRATRAGPRRPPTRSCRCWPPTPAISLQVQTGHRLAPAPLRRLGRRLLAARVRPRAVARPAARGRGRPGHVRRADRRRSGSATRAICSRCATDDGPVLWPIDRADDGARVERRAAIPPAPALPRLPPPDRAPPPRAGATTARPTTTRGPGARRASTPRDFVARVRSAGRRRRRVRVRARHRAARALVVRGRATGSRGGRRGRATGAAR